ncbi:hypothetical protein GH733_015356, partial [Mirounga leonina]
MQDEVQRENTNLQKLHAQKQQVQELLDGLDEQKSQLEEQLKEVRKKCAEEAQLISSLKAELTSQESQISTYEEELAKAREELSRLQQETAELEESVESGKAHLGPLQQHLQDSQQEISSMQMKLMEMKELENRNNQLNWCSSPHSILVNGATDYCSLSTSSSETANLNEHAEGQGNLESEPIHQESPVETLKHNDPFAPGGIVVAASDSATDPFASVFGSESFEDGFADFSTLSKVNNEDPFSSATSSSVNNVVIKNNVLEETSVKSEDVPPALPPKIGTPTRPCPPPPGKRPINKLDSSDPFKLNDPFQPFPDNDSPKEKDPDMFCDSFTSTTTTTTNKEADPSNFANFS